LPIAREVRGIIIETYEYLITLPDENAREAHLATVEKGLLAQYTPRMKQLTLRQGKMLIKLSIANVTPQDTSLSAYSWAISRRDSIKPSLPSSVLASRKNMSPI
jgi:hypothetical protein